MRQPRAIAANVANSTAFRFSTGNAPGMPRQTGQTFVFGGSPKRVEQEQKIFEAVSSCTWTSSPMTGSYFARTSSEIDTLVAMREIIDALADQARRLQRPQRLKPQFKSEASGTAQSRAVPDSLRLATNNPPYGLVSSAGSYPLHSRTGSRGYFGNLGSRNDRSQRKNTE